MLQYIIRRILLMIPTLLGITLVTFLIVHLMPGKPGQIEEAMRKGVDPEALEAQKRRFFLDLPLFVNTNVEDGPAAINRVIDRAILPPGASKDELLGKYSGLLTSEELSTISNTKEELLKTRSQGIRERGQKNLLARGGVATPLIFARLDEVAGALTPKELDTLLSGLTKSSPSGKEDLAAVKGHWASWWKENEARYDEEKAAELLETYLAAASGASGSSARDYLRAADPAVVAELTKLGTFALPLYIDIIRHTDDDGEVGAAAALLSDITSVSYSFAPQALADEDYDKIDRVIYSWGEWWNQYRRDYEAYSGSEKLFGFFTETQYAKWFTRIVTFDFGVSQVQIGRPVLDILLDALPNTLLISMVSLFVAYLISIPIGVASAANQGSFFDRAMTVVLFVLYSLPSFWVALMLIALLCGQGYLDWFPITGLHSRSPDEYPLGSSLLDLVWHMVLPVVCLTYSSLASLSRYQRVGMLDVVRQDYIRTARAKGLAERVVIWKHAVRNSLLPVITLLGLQIPFLVGGSVITEGIFQIPGMGNETFQAILSRDYPVVMAVIVLTAVVTMLALLLSDVLYAIADPRISYKK